MVTRKWTRDELILAFNLYCKIPFGKMHARNQQVIELASAIGRSPSSVALKLSNFARLDPALRQRRVSGMRHGSKAEIDVWNEFQNDWDELAFQSEAILARRRNMPLVLETAMGEPESPAEGKDREAIIRVRVNQQFFRQTVLASYRNQCCITGIDSPPLLVASHIVPWSADKRNRMNPCNGLCLNALHDRAFDAGLITVTPDFRLKLSRFLKERTPANEQYFLPYEGRQITLPERFLPSAECLLYHNTNVFVGS